MRRLLTSAPCFRRPAGVLLTAALWSGPVAAAETFDAEAFHAYVERAVSDWNATGLAVAVVRGRDLLFARGYGVLELGRPGTVDPDTLVELTGFCVSIPSE